MKITLKNLSRATEQQVFNQAYIHLITQGKRAASPDLDVGGCAYLTNEGLKCAAGCFIAEDEYNPEFENNVWAVLVNDYGVTNKHYDIIVELQHIHDSVPVALWKEKLAKIAEELDLTIPEIT